MDLKATTVIERRSMAEHMSATGLIDVQANRLPADRTLGGERM
jgi:hypothetical protein